MTALPSIIDRMPPSEPRLLPKRVVAVALNSVPHEWWPGKKSKGGRALLSEDSLPVRAVLLALDKAGYDVVER